MIEAVCSMHTTSPRRPPVDWKPVKRSHLKSEQSSAMRDSSNSIIALVTITTIINTFLAEGPLLMPLDRQPGNAAHCSGLEQLRDEDVLGPFLSHLILRVAEEKWGQEPLGIRKKTSPRLGVARPLETIARIWLGARRP